MNEFGSPSRCNCLLRPRCEYHHCGAPADWSVFVPPTRPMLGPYGQIMFMCEPCRAYYTVIFKQPLKGIDRPDGADEDWRPSLVDHLRFAQIDFKHQQRNNQASLAAPKPRHQPDPAWLAKVDRMFADAERSRSPTVKAEP